VYDVAAHADEGDGWKEDAVMKGHRGSEYLRWSQALALGLALLWAGGTFGQTPWVEQANGRAIAARSPSHPDEPAPAATTTEVGERWLEWVAMPDGILLATEVLLPEGPGPFPAVLLRTPYDRATYIPWVSYHVPRGYAGVVQQCRGTEDSQGEFYAYREDAADGRATIEWIAQQAWSDGKVGMIGRSAMGATQYAVAEGAPAALKCLSPAIESPDRYHHIVFQGGALRYELVHSWLSMMGLLNVWEDLKLHRLWSDWWLDFHWIGSPETIHVPILHMGGWYDMAQQGALDAFRITQHQGGAGAVGNQYLQMDPRTHLGGFGQLPMPPSEPDFVAFRQQLTDTWLDYWLKEEPTGVDSWPHVRIYLMGASGEPGAPGNTWVEMPDWPPPAETRAYHLSQDRGLTESIPAPGQIVLPIDPLDPVPTQGGANLYAASGPYDQATIESRDDVVTFTTELLTVPTTVIGPVTATIWINPDTPDLDLSVRLTDVYPDGRSMLVIDGIQRARMRCADDVECFLEPGVPTEIEVNLWSTAMVFNADHRIRIAIAGTNWNRFEVNSNDGGDLNNPNCTVAYPLILFGPDYPTSIELPIPFILPFSDGFESGDTSGWSMVVP